MREQQVQMNNQIEKHSKNSIQLVRNLTQVINL